MELKIESQENRPKKSDSPTGMKIFWNEIKKDKLALGSFILLAVILIYVYGASIFMDAKEIARVDFFSIYLPPSAEHWLGTDYGGRDIFGQLIIGTRNSFTISLLVTTFTAIIGLTLGLLSGYFGGFIDNAIMRLTDFFLSLPTIMFIVVLAVVVPKFNVITFVLIMTLFLWMGKTRIIRSKVLAERELDYVHASQTLGTPHWKIILFQVLPNVSSIIIVNFILNLAGNIGLETSLTFLGFGLPESTPSLGTLISYATNPDVLENKWWIWIPASVMILILMLSINFIGQALKRAVDARQRRG
ncbi:ABC transporter permease [Bacillus massiliglaciei]|uniref:ABC transporter permease n=1 Tax=Bacillus massiliglaciei TaxID=1816693 RepID=UPI000AE530F0|nr:ABC transporter permease [Bacillus massiliglaciei]